MGVTCTSALDSLSSLSPNDLTQAHSFQGTHALVIPENHSSGPNLPLESQRLVPNCPPQIHLHLTDNKSPGKHVQPLHLLPMKCPGVSHRSVTRATTPSHLSCPSNLSETCLGSCHHPCQDFLQEVQTYPLHTDLCALSKHVPFDRRLHAACTMTALGDHQPPLVHALAFPLLARESSV